MKIIFDHQIFCAQKFGGISRYYAELVKWLNTLPNTNARVVAPFHQNCYLDPSDSQVFRSNYFSHEYRGAGRVAACARNFLLPIHYKLNGDADIIHETYYAPKGVGTSKYRVLTVYDMIHEIFTNQFTSRDKTSSYKAAAIKRADHIICISESTRNDLISMLGVEPDKTSVVYLGHELTESYNNMSIFQKWRRPYLLYVGSRSGYKNFNGLLLSYANSSFLRSDFDLIAFGGGKFSAEEVVEINKLGLSDFVFNFSGNDNLLAHFYKNAAAFVYPSLYEGFGIPPLEAMNYNCPVVCSKTSSIPEVVGDAGCYFDPSSTESIRESIERVVSTDSMRASLIEAGANRLNKFTWERCAVETSNVYNSLLH